jgi:oligosaccharide repeat unit polymerase
MEWILKFTSLLLSGGILYMGYIARKASGTWLTPASIWCVGWFVLTFIPLLIAFSVPVNPLAILYILMMSIIFSIPVFGTKWKNVTIALDGQGPSPFDSVFLRVSFYLFALTSAASLTAHLSIQGVTFSALSTNFFETSSALIVDRYTESTIENIFAQISNISTYVTVCLGGLIFPGYRGLVGKLRILFLSMAPSLALMTIAGAKGTIFLCIAIFYGGFLVRRLRKGDNRLIDIGTLSRASAGLAVLLPFVTISFLSRGLYEDAATVDLSSSLYRNFVSYSSAHIYAFSDWFSWYIGSESHIFYARDELTGGFFTFMSIFKALGSTKVVPPGYYDEYFQYSWFLQTNIYTIFRGLITDFSLPGSIVFMYIIGLVSNSIFVRLISNGMASWSVAFYVLFCGFVYTSFLISILVWSSMYPTFGIVGFLLLLNNERFAGVAGGQAAIVAK